MYHMTKNVVIVLYIKHVEETPRLWMDFLKKICSKKKRYCILRSICIYMSKRFVLKRYVIM